MESIAKKFIKNNRILSFIIIPLYRYINIYIYKANILRVLRRNKNPSMLAGELNLFTKIFSQCKVIVDVGARYDVDYLTISQGYNIKYYLFEPNPKFFRKLVANLRPFFEDITVENLAVSNKSGFCEYFEQYQTIEKNISNPKQTKKPSTVVKMCRLDEYFAKINLMQIDFLKTDIELHDYFALLGLGKLLDEILFIQFELGIGAEFEDGFVTNASYYELLENFDLYICADENNSLWSHFGLTLDLVKLDFRAKEFIDYAQKNGEGFNIFGVNKNRQSSLIGLEIGSL
jgi:FkbM family methyltransferase